MVTFLEQEPYTFNKFISSHKFLLIPDFQRSYSWKIKQLNDFFSSISEPDNAFIGIMVAAHPAGDEKHLEIVDDQQRITTLCLGLIALRHQVKNVFSESERQRRLIRNISEQLEQYDPDLDKHVSVLEPEKEELKKIYLMFLTDNPPADGKGFDKLQLIYLNNYRALELLITNYIDASLEKAETLYKKIVGLQFI